LEEAAQQITDKISSSGVNKIKRIEARNIKKIDNLRFKYNPTALIFGSFDQAKEQRSHLKNHEKLISFINHNP